MLNPLACQVELSLVCSRADQFGGEEGKPRTGSLATGWNPVVWRRGKTAPRLVFGIKIAVFGGGSVDQGVKVMGTTAQESGQLLTAHPGLAIPCDANSKRRQIFSHGLLPIGVQKEQLVH